MNLAQEHLGLWQRWNKTHRWPSIGGAWREYKGVQPPNPNATSVVLMSMYPYADSTQEFEADNSGRVGRYGARYDMGPYESNAFYLQPKQMNELQRLLPKLPRSRKVLEWSDVLLISGRRNGRWFVRMYSRKHQPKPVRQLLYLLSNNPKTNRR